MSWGGRDRAGTSCRIAYDYGDRPPAEGDLLKTPAGSCYLVDEVRQSPTLRRVYLRCTRLGRDAVRENQDGVWPLHWHPR